MQPEPQIPPTSDRQDTKELPPPTKLEPSVGASAPGGEGAPPPLAQANRGPSQARHLLALLLGLGLALFLADAFLSFFDDTLILLFGVHLLGALRGFASFFALLIGMLIYVLIAFVPAIPRRFFMPIALYNPLIFLLASLPVSIFFYKHIQQASWVFSFCQVVVGLGVLRLVQGKLQFRWPLFPQDRLEDGGFSWLNLLGFLVLNLFALLPVTILYLAFCAALAVGHFSDGFLALRPNGLIVQARKYVRDDGKAIELIPMAHVGEFKFYRQVQQSFPTNSIILLEGVTDERELLTNKLTYKRVAKSLGLSEQQREFKPTRGNVVRADVDVEEFTTNTIDFLNLVTLVHSKGLNFDTVMKLAQFSPSPEFEDQLIDDLLRKRNRRVLREIQARLPETDNIMVPWGAAHIPEIAREIQRSGFRLADTREFVAIQFRFTGNKRKTSEDTVDPEKPK